MAQIRQLIIILDLDGILWTVNLPPVMEVEVHRQHRRGSLRGESAEGESARKERAHEERGTQRVSCLITLLREREDTQE